MSCLVQSLCQAKRRYPNQESNHQPTPFRQLRVITDLNVRFLHLLLWYIIGVTRYSTLLMRISFFIGQVNYVMILDVQTIHSCYLCLMISSIKTYSNMELQLANHFFKLHWSFGPSSSSVKVSGTILAFFHQQENLAFNARGHLSSSVKCPLYTRVQKQPNVCIVPLFVCKKEYMLLVNGRNNYSRLQYIHIWSYYIVDYNAFAKNECVLHHQKFMKIPLNLSTNLLLSPCIWCKPHNQSTTLFFPLVWVWWGQHLAPPPPSLHPIINI